MWYMVCRGQVLLYQVLGVQQGGLLMCKVNRVTQKERWTIKKDIWEKGHWGLVRTGRKKRNLNRLK